MNTLFFDKCKTLDELQSEYRKLLLQFHPDRHANESPERIAEFTRKTQQLNAEYAYKAGELRASTAKAKAKSEGKPEPKDADYAAWAVVDEQIRQAIERIVFLPDLDIELCGFWVWVGGETRPVKDQLKAAGYKWAPQKEKWYYPGVPASSRGSMRMEDIRSRYGSTHIKSQARTRVERGDDE